MSNTKKILTLNCEQASRLLSENQDVYLTWAEKLALRFHLLICGSCRRYHKQLGFMRKLFGALAKKEGPDSSPLNLSDEKQEKIRQTLAKNTDSEK